VSQRTGRNGTFPDSGTEARFHVILEALALFFAGTADTSGTHGIDSRPKSLGIVNEPFYRVIFVNRVEVAGW
jgi:hypothetical protein